MYRYALSNRWQMFPNIKASCLKDLQEKRIQTIDNIFDSIVKDMHRVHLV